MSTSRKRILAALCILALMVVVGCSPAERNHTVLVEHNGTPALRITCQYVGKQPCDPNSYQNSHDYKQIDTDFYKITMENLTTVDIRLKRVDYRMKKGPTRGRQSASSESIKRTWGTDVIPAGSHISRANNLVWAESSSNTMLKTYFFVFETDDGSGQTLSAEVPLVYDR